MPWEMIKYPFWFKKKKSFAFPSAALGSHLLCCCYLRALPGGPGTAELLVADEKWFSGNPAMSPENSKPHHHTAPCRQQAEIQSDPSSVLREEPSTSSKPGLPLLLGEEEKNTWPMAKICLICSWKGKNMQRKGKKSPVIHIALLSLLIFSHQVVSFCQLGRVRGKPAIPNEQGPCRYYITSCYFIRSTSPVCIGLDLWVPSFQQ